MVAMKSNSFMYANCMANLWVANSATLTHIQNVIVRVEMRTLTIQFEFPDTYDHDDIEASLDSLIGDFMDDTLANNLTYTILERK